VAQQHPAIASAAPRTASCNARQGRCDHGFIRHSWRIVKSWLSGVLTSAPEGCLIRTTQDEELAVATGLPSQTQVIELLDGEFARAGYEIEDVVIDARARPPRITVIADGDTALDLDTIAELSHSASTLLDAAESIEGGYVLEVSSPGVDRPLTSAKHFRRARGRKVELVLADGTQVSGRVGETSGDTMSLVVRDDRARDWTVRPVPFNDIAKAVVQVEFSAPSKREMELANLDRSVEAEGRP
jgi:ribosome maturation factor RimP